MSDDSGSSGQPPGGAARESTARVRGIYTTALTRLLEDGGLTVVQASPPIRERFDGTFPVAPADAAVATTDDRQGVGVVGNRSAVADVVSLAREAGRDALAWRDPTPRGAVYDGEVTETLGSGALVELGDGAVSDGAFAGESRDGAAGQTDGADREVSLPPVAASGTTGFLPYSKTENHVAEGDRLRVQVAEGAPPWGSDRPVLDATIRVQGSLVSLVREGESESESGGASGSGRTSGGGSLAGGNGPELADLLSVDPPAGWRVDWSRAADDADLDALGDALTAANGRAETVDDALAAAGGETANDEQGDPPVCVWPGESTAWVWFGRESRFGLDERRRAVTATMAGHHRVKAGDERASAAVDLVEAICADAAGEGQSDFPFDAVTRQFGPQEGDTVRIEHGKPDGRRFGLGDGEVTSRDPDGTVVVRRQMSGRGTYDALGVDQQPGDVAVTKLTEGKWWYPTVYRGDDGEKRGTYVNVCTPVEVFPRAVSYVDLHVDVVKHADGTVERVDDDELDAAVAAGHVPESLAEKARSVASAVENAL